jgi:beta-phosphoglucomutase family hydrolase
MLEAAIFDMDGVIVDSHPIHKKAWRRFLELQGKHVADTDLNFIMEGRKREEILLHFLGNISDEEIRILGRKKEQLFREEAADVKTIKGVCGFLHQLSGTHVKVGVASSGSSGRVNYVLNALNLRHYFATVVTGDQVITGKPDPTIFLLACRRLGVGPSEAVVFEDSVSGVRAAKAAGAKCVALATNGVSPALLEAGADEIIPDFSSLSLADIKKLFD